MVKESQEQKDCLILQLFFTRFRIVREKRTDLEQVTATNVFNSLKESDKIVIRTDTNGVSDKNDHSAA